MQLLCLIQVRQPEFPIRDKEILQKNCITVGIVYCLHYIFVPLLSCGVLLFLEGFSCEKDNWCSCQGTTEAGKNRTNLHHHPALWNASLSLCLCPSSPSSCLLSSPPSFLSTLSLLKTKFKRSARTLKIFYILHTLWPWPWTQHYKALQLMMIYRQARLVEHDTGQEGHAHTCVKNPVVHVRVWRSMETPKITQHALKVSQSSECWSGTWYGSRSHTHTHTHTQTHTHASKIPWSVSEFSGVWKHQM